jgi:phosphohistidine phosphatase SixA
MHLNKPPTLPNRRLTLLACTAWWLPTSHAAEPWPALPSGHVVLMRHALAPGVGDPPGFTLGSCSTQRNLSDEGRAQARSIGQAFKARGVKVGAVWSSQWCRTHETAELAFGQWVRVDQPAFNSFFGQPDAAPEQTRAALALLQRWRGPGVLVVVTHQVNITALTGVVPAPGEAVVVQPSDQGLVLKGQFTP